MELLLIVLMLILLQYSWLGYQVGAARMKYSIKAPAIAGHPEFERRYRVHQNTLENLVVFMPATLAFAYLAESLGWPGYEIASVAGIFWLIGRFIYARAYVKDPATRAKGFLLCFAASHIMVVGALLGAVFAIITQS